MFKNKKIILLLSFVFIISAFAGAFAARIKVYKPDPQNLSVKTIEYLNELRKLNGLKPVARDKTAESVAEKRAQYQNGNFLTHNGLKAALKEIENSNYATENLAFIYRKKYNSDDEMARDLIMQWYEDKDIANKGHRKQMLNPLYDIAGVGIKEGKDNMYYISMVLASTTTMPLTKEISDQINEFYNYFETDGAKDSIPLPPPSK
ncbi:MAG: CAP domain-containing protein [Elusimicrobiota bacterium]|jgi:uncharacterized protein YkwD|nr:CAP domain-containing protein [Elusimicrobiota bacterium]